MPVPRHALVLTAGLGTRLRPLTLARAKPALPVGGTPLVRRILKWLATQGVDDVVLNLHYLPETITGVVGDGADLGVRVRYSWEQPEILGSAGGIRHALPLLGADTFLVINGDTLTDLDLEMLAAAHSGSDALVTMALTPNREPDRYSGVALDDGGRVTGFVERGSPQPSYHFFGVQIVQKSVFEHLPSGTPASTIGGVYDDLIRERPGAVRGVVANARFWDIGTPHDYWTSSLELLPNGHNGERRAVSWDDPNQTPERARIDRFLRDTGLGGNNPRVVPLTGDASDRRYFRILGSNERTLVLAVHIGPIEYRTLPFSNVWELFHRVPLPVPMIVGYSDALGILAQEDLGDVTLQAHLGAATPVEHRALYREAVALVELLQRRGAELQDDQFVPYGIAFDVEKLTWELNFFVRHFMEGYRGITLSSSERQALDEEWAAMAAELAGEPRVLCHRDYHSRNLMLHDGRLYIIDFQDARLGPDTYDLVSLLRDSYVDISDQDVDALIAYFLAVKGEKSTTDFQRRFDLMSLQRNLKALGTFGFQTTTRRNPVYIQYMPRTLRYARTNLQKYPRFGRLVELLAAHIEELK